MWISSGINDRPFAKYSMSVSMYRGGRGAAGRPRSAPPDLPSLLLDARICHMGMPIVSAVTKLLVVQFMWLDYDNPSKPIYLYINSSRTQVKLHIFYEEAELPEHSFLDASHLQGLQVGSLLSASDFCLCRGCDDDHWLESGNHFFDKWTSTRLMLIEEKQVTIRAIKSWDERIYS
ncbi:ATP-dependent Clp protease proteolytic subunit-related protein 1, chloroplastic [Tanacetum coccineum]|uniref:ATP-dependent Clp protease proteolytic subunit-related protein 1, chloroplastic n=1 Tax=Tanacetum coccineum TaxID=301880 RepID=A0ABQ5EMP7_9ASTR